MELTGVVVVRPWLFNTDSKEDIKKDESVIPLYPRMKSSTCSMLILTIKNMSSADDIVVTGFLPHRINRLINCCCLFVFIIAASKCIKDHMWPYPTTLISVFLEMRGQ